MPSDDEDEAAEVFDDAPQASPDVATVAAEHPSTSTSAEPASPGQPPTKTRRPQPLTPIVHGLFVVSFSHQVGPIVDWSYPPELSTEALEEVKKDLPFFALPDGAHLSVSDASYFHFLVPHFSSETVFGTSVHRQLNSTELLVQDPEVTRNNIQKAVVILSNAPIFGCVRDKLKIATEAWFLQRNFDDRGILIDLFNSMVHSEERDEATQGWPLRVADSPEAALLMGTSVRELLHRFRYHVLRLVKLLLLQKKVLFYGRPVETLCVLQYSLVSLIPELTNSLRCSGSPFLGLSDRARTRPTSLRTSDRASLLRFLGLPLGIFGDDAAFMPFASLHNVDILRGARSYLIGTTNDLLLGETDVDAVVNLETSMLDIKKPQVSVAIALSAADRKWIDSLVGRVDASYDASQPISETFEGSDDAIRAEFETYISALLAATKYAKSKGLDPIVSGLEEDNPLPAWNTSFMDAFRRTPAFEEWDRRTDDVLFDLVDPSHPCAGARELSLENIGLRMGDTFKDYGMEERLAVGRATLAKGSEGFWKMAGNLRQNAQKASFPSFWSPRR